MKKIYKTLLPFLATGVIASTMIPLASCTYKREKQESTYYIFLSGKDTIYSQTSNNEYTVETNLELTNIKWSIEWDGDRETSPTIKKVDDDTIAITTYIAGTFILSVGDKAADVSDSLSITIQDPTVSSNKIWFSQNIESVDTWCSIESWNTENINYKTLDGQSSSISLEDFNAELFFGEHVQVVGNAFLKGCTNFNSTIHFNDDLQVIGNEFLKGCTNFNNGSDGTTNKPIILNCGYIGFDFLYNCQNFDNSVTVSANVEDIGENFMFNCIAMTTRENNPSQIYINTSFLNFAADTEIPLTFAAIEKVGTAWADNGLPVVFQSENEQQQFCDVFKDMAPSPQDPDAFFRHINGSHQ